LIREATNRREAGLRFYLNTSLLAFGLAALSTSLGQVILPFRVLDLAPESLKNTYLGILTFAGMAVAMAVQPAIGYLSDRGLLPGGRRRPYIIAGVGVAVVAAPLVGLATSFAVLVIGVVLVQAGLNAAQNPYDALIKDQSPAEQRGRVSSVRAMAGAVGAVLLVVAAGVLMDGHSEGERDVWLWASLALPVGLLLAVAAWTWATLREKEVGTGEVETGEIQKVEGAHPQLGRLLAAGFLFALAGGVLQTYTLFFLRDVVGLENPASALGVLAAVVGGTVALTLWPAGFLADRVGRRPLLMASAAMGSAGSFLFLAATNLPQIMAIGVLMGAAVGIFMSAGRAMITDMVSRAKAAHQLGIANLALLAGLAASKGGGAAIDGLNRWQDDLGYNALLAVCGACFLAGGIMVATLKAASPADEEGGLTHRSGALL